MRTILRYILVMTCLLMLSPVAKAQITSYDLTLYKLDKDTKEKVIATSRGIVVYFFTSKGDADRAHKKLSDPGKAYEPLPNGEFCVFAEKMEAEDGRAIGRLGRRYAYCFAFDEQSIYISNLVDIKKMGDTYFDIVLEECKGNGDEKNVMLDDRVVVSATNNVPINASTLRIRGRMLPIEINYPIGQKATNAKTRYVLAPSIYVLTDTVAFTSEALAQLKLDSVISFSPPIVRDGVDYQKTMHRRMAYDSNNDPLYPYVNKDVYLESNKDTIYRFLGRDTIFDINFNHRYPVYAHRWYENYQSILIHDTILVADGFAKNTYRFMDLAINSKQIDESRYWIKPKSDWNQDSKSLNLNFPLGKHELLSDDSVSFIKLDKLINRIRSIFANSGEISTIILEGQSSPEGRFERNKELATLRAVYVQNYIRNHTDRYLDFQLKESKVATWADVAKLMLAADSVQFPERREQAQQLLAIAGEGQVSSQQYAQIKNLPFYQLIDTVYLPQLRKTDVTIYYKEQHEWTYEEVIEKYKEDKTYTFAYPYQYSYLFKYLRNEPAELKRYAKEAMEVSEGKHKRASRMARKEITASWPLAAYYYAKCLVEEGVCDTTILQPYIDLSYKLDAQTNERLVIWNDPAICIEQVRMLARAGYYDKASRMLNTLFKGNKDLATLDALLNCMNGADLTNEEKRLVKSTSPWNNVIMLAAAGENEADPEYKSEWYQAYDILTNDSVIAHDSGRVYYMIATLANRLCGRTLAKRPKAEYKPSIFTYNKYIDQTIQDNEKDPDRLPANFGWWMVKACEMDPSLLNVLRLDGEFTQNYRDGFAKYWNSLDPKTHRHLK